MTKLSYSGRVAALIASVAAVSLAAGPAASAATAQPAQPAHEVQRAQPVSKVMTASGPISWSVLPASATASSARPDFNYTSIKPGSKISDHVEVVNRSKAGVDFTIYATDATGTTASNVLTFLPAAKKPKDIGSWVSFPRKLTRLSFIIPGHKAIIEPFTIAVPRHARPGDHTGGMVASVSFTGKGRHGQVVAEDERVVVPILMRVTGKLRAGLQVDSVSASYGSTLSPFSDGTATVSYTVMNTGNIRLAGRQAITVHGPFGLSARVSPAKLPVVLPGDSIRLTAKAARVFPAGPFSAHVTLSPANPADAPPLTLPLRQASGSASLFAVPWALLLLLVLVAGAVVGGRELVKWRRRTVRAQLVAVAEHTRRETERKLLSDSAKPATAQGQE